MRPTSASIAPPDPSLVAGSISGTPLGAIRVTATSRGVREVRIIRETALTEVSHVLRSLVGMKRGADGPCPKALAGNTQRQPPAAERPAVFLGNEQSAAADPAAWTVLQQSLEELRLYFEGRLRRFTVPLDLDHPHSSLERQVWEELRAIPWGDTRSYGEVARRLGRPGAARAVGRACSRNPAPIIVPCHRVVGADGSLTGFTGGLDLKVRLLSLEGGEAGTRPAAARRVPPALTTRRPGKRQR
jgi:methylated-DNA-[protein]-cysteine S-methyltransferase